MCPVDFKELKEAHDDSFLGEGGPERLRPRVDSMKSAGGSALGTKVPRLLDHQGKDPEVAGGPGSVKRLLDGIEVKIRLAQAVNHVRPTSRKKRARARQA